MEFTEKVFKFLHDRDIKFVVVGGVALVLHGVVRLTFDLDLAISLDRSNLSAFLDVMKKLGMLPRVPVDPQDLLNPEVVESWKTEKGMKVFTFIRPDHPGDDIDMFIEDIIPFDDLYKDAVEFIIGRVPVKVVSIPHLKRMKQIAGRPQDLADLDSLSELERIGE
jgi:hypothetical protein